MELAVTGALGAAGYYLSQNGNKKNINNSFTPDRPLPNANNIYTSNLIGNAQYNQYSKSMEKWRSNRGEWNC